MRLVLATAALAVSVAAVPSRASVPNPPSFTDAQLAQGMVALADGIVELSGEPEPVDTEETRGDATVVLLNTDVLFEFGASALPANAAREIGRIVDAAPQGAAVTVVGHTDSIGDPGFNQRLSEDRAKAVAAAIAKARPDLDIEVSGKGESDPLVANTSGGQDDPEGRARNRRVEVSFER